MISFHPTAQDLQDFSAGVAVPAKALMISAHVDMCSKCQAACREYQAQLSDAMFADNFQSSALDDSYMDMMSDIMSLPKARDVQTSYESSVIELDGKSFELPRALRRYVKKTGNWSHLMGKLWQAPVDLGDAGKANFIYMEKGGRVPEHTHKGTEMTLVIDGQYSDGIANYDCGDFTLLDGHDNHLPHSEADDGCLVFTIVDQPLHFTAGIARLLNPFSQLFFK